MTAKKSAATTPKKIKVNPRKRPAQLILKSLDKIALAEMRDGGLAQAIKFNASIQPEFLASLNLWAGDDVPDSLR